MLLGASIIKDADGQLCAINAVITDNTDRKKYEAEPLLARRQAEQEKITFQYLSDLIPEMTWTADAEGRIDYVNERFSQYFGLKERQIDLNDVLSYIHTNDRPGFTDTWTSHIRSGKDMHIWRFAWHTSRENINGTW